MRLLWMSHPCWRLPWKHPQCSRRLSMRHLWMRHPC